MTDTIQFTENTYEAFKKAYNKAVEEGKHDFFFNGHQFLTSYAKYLIEYYNKTYGLYSRTNTYGILGKGK